MLVTLLLFLQMNAMIQALDNGLALTPPMGWLSWQRYRCNTDCKADPINCLSESLILEQARCLVKNGFRDAGYQYVSIDDCWLEVERGTDGRLKPDHKRFPNGMKALADYVHSLGLKLGIYEDVGTKTCAGYPGSQGYYTLDAQTFADWGVDLLKFDACNANDSQIDKGYKEMALALNKTGRPILYSTEGPLHFCDKNATDCDFDEIRGYCNMWRNYWDIQDSWESVQFILKYFIANGRTIAKYAGPGGWNDPDMLVIGNYGLSFDEERVQMALWSILAAPLIISADVCNMHPWPRSLLLNKRLIALNQDSLGHAGYMLGTWQGSSIQMWTRVISPAGSLAVAFINPADGGAPAKVDVTLDTLGLTSSQGYWVTELFDGQEYGVYYPTSIFEFFVNPSGVFMFTATML